MKGIRKSLLKRRLIRILVRLLKKIAEEKTAAQAMLYIFLETEDRVLKKNTFKKLKNLFSRLSFTTDIYPALGPEKIEDPFKAEFWEMVLKFGIDNAEVCSIVRSSDFFFAKQAFDELNKRFKKGKISKDRMRSFLVDTMIYRSEFASEGWLLLKSLGFSYDDILEIKSSDKYQSDFYEPIRAEIGKMLGHLDRSREKMLRRVGHIFRAVRKINELEQKGGKE